MVQGYGLEKYSLRVRLLYHFLFGGLQVRRYVVLMISAFYRAAPTYVRNRYRSKADGILAYFCHRIVDCVQACNGISDIIKYYFILEKIPIITQPVKRAPTI